VKKWLVRLGALAGVVALFVLAKLTILAPKPVPVQVSRVERGTVEETVTNSRAGTVRARLRAKLSPELGGQVVAIPFREGDQVQAGSVVLRLDDSTYRAQVELARRELEAAGAERQRACLGAERAGREAARIKKLADEQIVSEDVLDAAESAHQVAVAACDASRATVSRAEASVTVAETQLSKTVLRAPFDGVVAEVAIEVGEWTTPSPPAVPVPAVIDILNPSSIYISAPMDEVDSARVRAGQPARVTVDSHRDQIFDGQVNRVAPYVLDVQEQNRTVEVEVMLVDAAFASSLLPGTSADIEVILTVREDALRIPTASLIQGGKVLLLEGERLVERTVEPGLRNWDYTEVLSGLQGGESVVTSLDRPEIKAGALAVVAEQDAD
jgi:HlyD family secretion protein